MSFGALDSLAALREYLAGDVLPGVATARQGELRAAIKVLEELSEELDCAPVVLHDETTTLHKLCTQSRDVLDLMPDSSSLAARIDQLGASLGPERLTLKAAQTLHDEAAACMSEYISALQGLQRDAVHGEVVKACLHECYLELSNQAARRAQWQSVFTR